MVLAKRLMSVGLVLLWSCAVFSKRVGESCFLGDDFGGTCMTKDRCPHLRQLQALGQRPPICFFKRGEPIYCCARKTPTEKDIEWRWSSPKRRKWYRRKYKTSSTSTPTQPTLPTPIALSMRMGKSWEKCQEYAKAVYQTVEVPSLLLEPEEVPQVADCAPAGEDLIVGGVQAKPKEFPHMAALGYGKSLSELKWLCGGSLISERFVMTAAHCIQPSSSQKVGWVRLGALVPSEQGEDPSTQTLEVEETFIPPGYANKSYDHDIALIKLKGDVRFTPYARPACLYADAKTPPGHVATATGWGVTDASKPNITSKDLLKVDLEYLPASKCRDSFAHLVRFKKLLKGFVEETMICAGFNKIGRDTCNGDSGGPLQVRLKEPYCMYSVVGLTSFGSAHCGQTESPAVYTRVSAYLGWIEDIVWPD